MATAPTLYQHHWSEAGIHTMTLKSKHLWVFGVSPFALLLISCLVSGPYPWDLPVSREDPPGSRE